MQFAAEPNADKSYIRQLKRLISGLLSVSKFQHSVYGQASQFFERDADLAFDPSLAAGEDLWWNRTSACALKH